MLKELLDSTGFYDKLKSMTGPTLICKASDREAWESLSAPLKEAHVKAAEAFLNYDYPSLLTAQYMDFIRTGNRSRHEKRYFDRRTALNTLVIGECIEHKGRFIDDIINGIMLICEETSWVIPAHNNGIMVGVSDEIYIDQFSAETSSLLSIIYTVLGDELDSVTPLITYRIRAEIEKRILKPYMENDFWWMSFGSKKPSMWNAWCNVNCMSAFLVFDDDVESQAKAIDKIVRSLDKFIDSYNNDGGCDEGVSYWEQTGGCLFKAFELLCDVDKEAEVIFDDEKVKNILSFPCKAHIDKDHYFNFADASSRVVFDAGLLYSVGSRTNNATMIQFSKYVYGVSKTSDYKRVDFEGRSLFRQMVNLFIETEAFCNVDTDTDIKNLRDVFFKSTEVMVARESAGADGLYLAVKGGGVYNNKDHNHNDVGSFIVYKNGNPFLIDVGVEVYTRQTFSSERFGIWAMQSQYHNLPTVSGIVQKDGSMNKSKNVAYTCTDGLASFSLDIADAYGEFSIEKFHRQFNFHRDDSAYIEITDEFELETHNDNTYYYFMCAQKPNLTEPGNIEIRNGGSKVNLYYNSGQFDFSCEEIGISDLRLLPVWGTKIYRVTLTMLNRNLKDKVYFKIV